MTRRDLLPGFAGAALAVLWLLTLHWQLAQLVAVARVVTGAG